MMIQSRGTSSHKASSEAWEANGSERCNGNGSEAAGFVPNPAGLLRLGEASAIFGLSQQTLRAACNSGQLFCVKLPSGHRRLSADGIRHFLKVNGMGAGEDSHSLSPADNAGPVIAIASRVSSSAQAKSRTEDSPDSDLSRQKVRLETFARARWPNATLVHYTRTSSGLNYESKVLNKLIADIVKKKVDVVLATYRDRIVRFGLPMLEAMASACGVQIIFTEEEPDKSDEQEMIEDITSLIFVMGCKRHGKRSGQRLRVTPDSQTLSDILTWHYKHGLSTYGICERLTREGRDHDEKNRKISRRIVRRLIQENKPLAGALTGDSPAVLSGSLHGFAKAQLRTTREGKRNLQFGKLLRAYKAYCRTTGEKPEDTRKVLRFIKSHFPDCPVTHDKATRTRIIGGLWLHKLKS